MQHLISKTTHSISSLERASRDSVEMMHLPAPAMLKKISTEEEKFMILSKDQLHEKLKAHGGYRSNMSVFSFQYPVEFLNGVNMVLNEVYAISNESAVTLKEFLLCFNGSFITCQLPAWLQNQYYLNDENWLYNFLSIEFVHLQTGCSLKSHDSIKIYSTRRFKTKDLSTITSTWKIRYFDRHSKTLQEDFNAWLEPRDHILHSKLQRFLRFEEYGKVRLMRLPDDLAEMVRQVCHELHATSSDFSIALTLLARHLMNQFSFDIGKYFYDYIGQGGLWPWQYLIFNLDFLMIADGSEFSSPPTVKVYIVPATPSPSSNLSASNKQQSATSSMNFQQMLREKQHKLKEKLKDCRILNLNDIPLVVIPDHVISTIHSICHRHAANKASTAISIEVLNNDFRQYYNCNLSKWFETNFSEHWGLIPWFFFLFRLQQLEFAETTNFLKTSHDVFIYTTTVKPGPDGKIYFTTRLLNMDALHFKFDPLILLPVDRIPAIHFPDWFTNAIREICVELDAISPDRAVCLSLLAQQYTNRDGVLLEDRVRELSESDCHWYYLLFNVSGLYPTASCTFRRTSTILVYYEESAATDSPLAGITPSISLFSNSASLRPVLTYPVPPPPPSPSIFKSSAATIATATLSHTLSTTPTPFSKPISEVPAVSRPDTAFTQPLTLREIEKDAAEDILYFDQGPQSPTYSSDSSTKDQVADQEEEGKEEKEEPQILPDPILETETVSLAGTKRKMQEEDSEHHSETAVKRPLIRLLTQQIRPRPIKKSTASQCDPEEGKPVITYEEVGVDTSDLFPPAPSLSTPTVPSAAALETLSPPPVLLLPSAPAASTPIAPISTTTPLVSSSMIPCQRTSSSNDPSSIAPSAAPLTSVAEVGGVALSSPSVDQFVNSLSLEESLVTFYLCFNHITYLRTNCSHQVQQLPALSLPFLQQPLSSSASSAAASSSNHDEKPKDDTS